MKLTLCSSEIKDFDRRAGSPREIIVHLNHSRPTHIKFPPSLTFIFVGLGKYGASSALFFKNGKPIP